MDDVVITLSNMIDRRRTRWWGVVAAERRRCPARSHPEEPGQDKIGARTNAYY